MLIRPNDIVEKVHGGRVLDVATGHGGFVRFLVDGLRDYDEILGIDAATENAPHFEDATRGLRHVQFQAMDAQAMTFDHDSFDTVAVAVSLHHFEDPPKVLREMLRVLKPGGHLIVDEMYKDGQTPTQMTHVELHHWAAAIDRAEGITHRETYTRSELLRLLDPLTLEEVQKFDLADESDDPKEPETIAAHEAIVDRQLSRTRGRPDLERLGRRIRRRLAAVGIHSATELVYVGRKPW